MDQQAQELLDKPSEQNIDLVVVHNPRVARQLAPIYPLIITGHTHQQSIEFIDDAVILNPGSSGAAGMRGLYTDQVILIPPLSFTFVRARDLPLLIPLNMILCRTGFI